MSGVSAASRIVIKIGSSSLSRGDGGLDLNRIDSVARPVTHWRRAGHEVVIMSSGTVAAGLNPLDFTSKPRDLLSIQAVAAMGQGFLMARWTAAFQTHHLDAAQVLSTADGVMHRDHHTNVRASLTRLLGLDVIPILNESDAVTTRELYFDDNDRLAMLIAQIIETDALVLLTGVDDLYTAPPDYPGSKLVERVESADGLMSALVTGAGSRVSTGGMATKIQTAMLASVSSIGVQLVSADAPESVLADKNVSTWFEPLREHPVSRRLWIAHVALPCSEIIVDESTAQAITVGEKSLLVAGVRSVLGHFEADDVVDMASPTELVTRGVSGYGSDTLTEIAGSGTAELQATGHEHLRPVIYRDDLAVLGDTFSALSAD